MQARALQETTRSVDVQEFGEPQRIGVMGASGTAGAELIRLLQNHPRAEVACATARQSAGVSLQEIDPGAPDVQLCHPDDVVLSDLDVVFLCLPHGAAAAAARKSAAAGVRTIDLSGDLRLHDESLHEATYGTERDAHLARSAVYGLTEFARDEIRAALVVSNPGCYPTCAAMALLPLAEADRLGDAIVIDAKSGVSGAGRAPTATTHFLSVTADVRPYKTGRRHRHVPEIEQVLSEARDDGANTQVVFNPHLVPIERGIEETITLIGGDLDSDEICDLLVHRYRHEPFVDVLTGGREARIRGVVGTNRVQLAVHDVADAPAVVITAAIDNLLKGAAGQALQNMNVMFGWDETLGLPGALDVHSTEDDAEFPRSRS